VDRVVVKGKTETVGVYEVLDYHSAESFPNLMEAVNHFQEGLQKYRNQQWDRAIQSFGKAGELNRADEICRMYIDRCNFWKETPPAADWDGAWIMDSK
jgi:adenylate cyclase